MNISVNQIGGYHNVEIEEGNTKIDMGLLDEKECYELAKELIDAVWYIGPADAHDCHEWLVELLKDCGIELPAKEAE